MNQEDPLMFMKKLSLRTKRYLILNNLVINFTANIKKLYLIVKSY